jgi:FMN phosphatase YigB (HAD superfamily)
VDVFLDLYGVVVDSERMARGYRERLADLLFEEFGGSRGAWLEAHDRAWSAYGKKADAIDWESEAWIALVDRLDADHIEEIFGRAGVEGRPDDLTSYAREIEFRVTSGVQARFPDARTAIERLRTAGHRVHVATQATDTNARGALAGAGLLGAFDRIFTGTTQNARKSSRAYWKELPAAVGARPDACLVLDDRLDYLESAAAAGLLAVLVDRARRVPPEELPSFVQASFRNLASLPHYVETLASRA